MGASPPEGEACRSRPRPWLFSCFGPALRQGERAVIASALTPRREPAAVWLKLRACAGCSRTVRGSAQRIMEDSGIEGIYRGYRKAMTMGAGACMK